MNARHIENVPVASMMLIATGTLEALAFSPDEP